MLIHPDHAGAVRPLAAFAALLLLLLATPALAQFDGGHEGREFDVVVDPTGARIHVATVWFGEGESIWQAREKLDPADLGAGVDLVDRGTTTIPAGLFTSYRKTKLTEDKRLYDVHTYQRPSDGGVELMLGLGLEPGCVSACRLATLDMLKVPGHAVDLENPVDERYGFSYAAHFDGLAGDVMMTHDVR